MCESHDFIKESYGDDVWKLVRESRCQVGTLEWLYAL